MPLEEFSSNAPMLSTVRSCTSRSNEDVASQGVSCASGEIFEEQTDFANSPRESSRKIGDIVRSSNSLSSQEVSGEEKININIVKSSSGFFGITSPSEFFPDRWKSSPSKTSTMDCIPKVASQPLSSPVGKDVRSATTDFSSPVDRNRKMRQTFSSTFKFGGASSKKRRHSNNPTNPISSALDHAIRFATSSLWLRSEILNQCKEENTFDAGQVVYDDGSSECVQNCIMYIESGLCEWIWRGLDPVTKPGSPPTMCFTGGGAFLGVSRVLLGMKGRSRYLVARSKVVTRLLRIEMQSNNLKDETDMPVCFEGFSPETSATLWEHITHDQVQKSLDMKTHVHRLIKQVPTTPLA
jgi:hypothetical protein